MFLSVVTPLISLLGLTLVIWKQFRTERLLKEKIELSKEAAKEIEQLKNELSEDSSVYLKKVQSILDTQVNTELEEFKAILAENTNKSSKQYELLKAKQIEYALEVMDFIHKATAIGQNLKDIYYGLSHFNNKNLVSELKKLYIKVQFKTYVLPTQLRKNVQQFVKDWIQAWEDSLKIVATLSNTSIMIKDKDTSEFDKAAESEFLFSQKYISDTGISILESFYIFLEFENVSSIQINQTQTYEEFAEENSNAESRLYYRLALKLNERLNKKR